MEVHVAVFKATFFYFCLLLAAYTSLAEESLTSSVHATSPLKDTVHPSPDHSFSSTSNSKTVETKLLSPRNRRDLDPNQIRQFYNNNKVSNRALQSAFRYNDEILRSLLQSQTSYNKNPYNSARSEFFYNILRPLDRRTTRYNSWDDHSVMHFGKRSVPTDDLKTIQLNEIESIPSDGQTHAEDREEKLNVEKRSIPSDESRSIHSNARESVLPDNSKSISTDGRIKQKYVLENGGVVKRSSSWSDHGVLHFGKREYDENKLENKDNISNQENNSTDDREESRKEEERLADHLDLSDIDKRDNDPWHSMMSFGKRDSNDPWHSVMSFGKRDGSDPWHNVMSFGKRDGNDPWHSVMSFGKRDGNDPWHSVMSFGKRDGNDPWHNVMSFGKRDSNDPWHSVMSFGKRDGNDPWHNVMSFGKRDSNDPWHNVMSFGKRTEKITKDTSDNNKGTVDFLEKGSKQKRSIRENSEPGDNELVPEKRFDMFKDHNTMHFGKKSDSWDSHNTMHFGKKSDPWDSHNTLHFGKKSDHWNSHDTMHFRKKSDPWDSHNTMHFGKKSDPWESHTMHFGKKSDPWDTHNTMHFGKRSDDVHGSLTKVQESKMLEDTTEQLMNSNKADGDILKLKKRSSTKTKDEDSIKDKKLNNQEKIEKYEIRVKRSVVLKNVDAPPKNTELQNTMLDNQKDAAGKKENQTSIESSENRKGKKPDPQSIESKSTASNKGKRSVEAAENKVSNYITNPQINEENSIEEPNTDEDKVLHFGKRSIALDEFVNSRASDNQWNNEEEQLTKRSENSWDLHNTMHFGKKSDPWDSHNTMHFGKKADPWESHTMHFGKKSDPWDSHNTMHFGKKSDPWDSHNTMHFGKKSDPWESHTMHFGKKSDPWESHTLHFGKKSDPWESHTMHFGKKSDPWDSHNTMHFGKKSDPWDSHNTMHFGKRSDPWDSHNTLHFGKRSDAWDSHNTMHFGKRSNPWDSHNTMHFGKKSDPWDSHNTMHFGKRSDPWDSHNTLHFGKKSESSGNQSSLNSDLSVGITNDEGASTFQTVPEMMYLNDFKNSQENRLKWNEYLSHLLAKLKEGTFTDSDVQSVEQYLTSLLQRGNISPEEPPFRNGQILLEFLDQLTDSEDTSNRIQEAEDDGANMDEEGGDPDPRPKQDSGMKTVNKRYWAPFQGARSIIYPHAWFASQIRRSVPVMEAPRMFETRMAEKKEDPVNSFMHFGKR